MNTCRVCNRQFEYNDEVGYSPNICGPYCDGIEIGFAAAKKKYVEQATEALGFFANIRERIYVMQEEQMLAGCVEREAAKLIEALKEPSKCN